MRRSQRQDPGANPGGGATLVGSNVLGYLLPLMETSPAHFLIRPITPVAQLPAQPSPKGQVPGESPGGSTSLSEFVPAKSCVNGLGPAGRRGGQDNVGRRRVVDAVCECEAFAYARGRRGFRLGGANDETAFDDVSIGK